MAERGKEFPLSIVLRTVDRATAGLKQFNDRIEKQFKPYKEFGKQLSAFSENLGLPKLRAAFARVGQEISSIVRQLGGLAVGAVAAVYGFKQIVDQFDELGDKAERIAVSVDFLAQLRYAAQRSGAELEEIDAGLETFTKSLGQARAGTGRLTSFLTKVSPALLKQLKGAKSNEEAFALMADAMAKVKDPAKRAALATAAFGGSGVALAPLLGKGSKGIAELMQRYLGLAGSQEQAVEVAGRADDAMHDLSAGIQGVKASLVVGLGPAFIQLIDRLRNFFTENRERIAEWIRDFGEKLPSRIDALVTGIGKVASVFRDVWDFIGGAKGALIAFAAIKLAGLVSSIMGVVSALTQTVIAIRAASAAQAAAGGAGGAAGGGVGAAGKAASVAGAALAGYELGGVLDNAFGLSDELSDKIGFLSGRAPTPKGIDTRNLTGIDREIAIAREKARVLNDPVFREKAARLTKQKLDEENGIVTSPTELGAPITTGIAPPASAAAGPAAQAHVTVDFANAPKGTRVTTDPRSTADVDLSVGYQMVPAS